MGPRILQLNRRTLTRLLLCGGLGGGAYFGQGLFHQALLPPPPVVRVEMPDNEVLLRMASRPRAVIRMFEIVVYFLPFLLLYPLTLVVPSFRLTYYRWLKNVLEFVGPAFIKLGQWAVTREDLVPHDMCVILGELHQHVSPHSLQSTKNILRQELGRPVEEVFSEFDEEPVGSGSIAQVYRAVLRETGQEVAVKVSHPNVTRRISLDFLCIKWFSRIIDPFVRFTDINAIADQFATNLSLQVDLRFEARNLERFNKNFEHNPFIVFPVPILELTTRQVLVESFIHGRPMAELTEECANEKVVTKPQAQLSQLGMEAFLQMVLADNFFHADLHPGNIMYQIKGGNTYLTMVDAGITQTLEPSERDTMFKFMQGLQLKDPQIISDAVLSMADVQKFCDPEKFRSELATEFAQCVPNHPQPPHRRWLRKMGIIGLKSQRERQVQAVVETLFKVARDNHVTFESSFASLLCSVLFVEGVCNVLDPNFDVIAASRKWFLASPMERFLGLSKARSAGPTA